MKKALVCGAGGFIGNHMVNRLKLEKYYVVGVDLVHPDYSISQADEFYIGDLRDVNFVEKILNGEIAPFDEIYQFAADMGGAGFVFTGENDADIMHNSVSVNLNILQQLSKFNAKRKINETTIFYSSSACMYPEHNQIDPDNPNCAENSAYPANPDSEYGWEKLFSERLYLAFNRNYGIKIKIARYHNIFGPLGTFDGGREKAPAAICRKIASTSEGGSIEIWGDGNQTRSFLYIDECIEATRRLVQHKSFNGPVNIGSEEKVTINELVSITTKIAGKKVKVEHVIGPTGVRGRNSDNTLINQELGWNYSMSLYEGIDKTYNWILHQINEKL